MTTRRTSTFLTTTALVVGLLALGPGPAGGQSAACSEPYSPVAFAEASAGEELPDAPGTDISLRPGFAIQPDTDGDGVDDTIDEGPGDTATVTRGTGDLVLTAAGADSIELAGVPDIDGDGRTELSANVDDGPTPGTYLVPGTTPDGTVAIVDAGILVDELPALPQVPGDGSGRLVIYEQAYYLPGQIATTYVLDAAATLALGPGADATGTAEVTYDGEILAFADLGDGAQAMVISTTDPEGAVDLQVVRGDGEVVLLTTAPELFFQDPPALRRHRGDRGDRRHLRAAAPAQRVGLDPLPLVARRPVHAVPPRRRAAAASGRQPDGPGGPARRRRRVLHRLRAPRGYPLGP